MKIRKGFISNSSSSSFVILGFRIDPEDFNKEQQEKIFNNQSEDIRIIIKNDNEYIYGVKVSDGDIFEHNEYYYNDLVNKLKKNCEEIGLTMPNEIKIFTGSKVI